MITSIRNDLINFDHVASCTANIKMNSIDKEQVEEAEETLLSAIKSNDISTLDELLHDDLLFITPDGQMITKNIDLDSHRDGTMVVEKVKSVIEKIKLIGTTAIAVTVYETRGKMQGKAIAGKFRYIRFWKLDGGRLKVVGGSCTQIQS